MIISQRGKKIVVFAILGLICLFLAFNRHSKRKYHTYQSEIWADKAGYYIYLPATFKYGFNAKYFPDKIDKLTGDGFKLFKETGKVKTKYTYGVALLQLPFYFIADLTAYVGNFSMDGFSPPYHWAIDLAAVSYLVLGLYFLFSFLSKHHNSKSVICALAILFLGTNLYYYAIDEVGMSHIYSFCLFSMAIYFGEKYHLSDKRKFDFAWGALLGLIILIRPTNLIFVLFICIFSFTKGWEIEFKSKFYINFYRLFYLVSGTALIWLPQFIYWYYLSGSTFTYSYEKEAFDWLHPNLAQVWLAPNNGLFLYSPFVLILVLILAFGSINTKNYSFSYLIYFMMISYIFAAWWDPSFGCSFGARSFVEHYAIYAFPLSSFFQAHLGNRKLITGITIIFLLCIAYNLKMTYTFGGCFIGTHTWDWKAYTELLTSPTK